MEWAIFISKAADLKYWDKKYSRIYFGIEFCERLIPDVRDMQQVLDFVSKNKLALSLVTCFVTDQGLQQTINLLQLLHRFRPGSEVVINDWGLLRVVKDLGLKPVLGRLLVKQKRDPRILDLKDKISKAVRLQLQDAKLNSYFLEFLKDKGIERAEIDNLLQGIKTEKFSFSSLSFSLYVPFGYITTTRICPFIPANKNGERLGIFPCDKECRTEPFTFSHPSMSTPLILKGNTVFFENHKMPDNEIGIAINRIVYQAVLPF